MRTHYFAALVVAVAAVAASSRPGFAQEPSEPPILDKPDFSKPPPPNEPPPADGGPNAYVHTPDEVIALFEAKVRLNPNDFLSYRYLGEALERKARDQDDLASYAKAEFAFRKAIELMPNYARAQAGLAAVLCSRHKFAEGLAIAKSLVEREPKNIDALSTIGDAQLELGRYDEAEATFEALYKLAPIPEVLARQASLAENRGQVDQALELLRKAADEAGKQGTARSSAWYRVRLADISFQVGKLSEAEALYQDVLRQVPEQHDATYGLGLVRAAQGRTDEALSLLERAVAIGPDPHMVVSLGDLCVRAGRPEEARALFERLGRSLRDQPEFLRARSLFLADHDRDLTESLRLAEEDLLQRKDVHGYDALAWALLKNGRAKEAAEASSMALKLGTKDAALYYHAGMIQAKLGDREKAKELLGRALAINPHFAIAGAEAARKSLAGLGK